MHIVFPATMDSLQKILQFIRVEARAAGFEGHPEMQIEIALEEVIVNIIKHGYPDKTGNIEIVCSAIGQMGLSITVSDDGLPYNPLKGECHTRCDEGESFELKAVGGFGVNLILSLMDKVEYNRRDNKNVLLLIKYR